MGRYLGNGILTDFSITKADDRWGIDRNFCVKKELDSILEDINRIIDTSMYDIVQKDKNYYVFSLKPEIFDENIHDVIKEMSILTFPNIYIFNNLKNRGIDFDIDDPDFASSFPLHCVKKAVDKYFMETPDEDVDAEYHYSFDWLLSDERLCRNLDISGHAITLWFDYNKYVGEDEYKMLQLMNTFKATFYKTKLSKSLVYFVSE